MKYSLKNSFGLAQIPLMIVLLLMAIAVPVATKLVQEKQDTRNLAAGKVGSVGNVCQLRGSTGEDCSSFDGNLGCACAGSGVNAGKTCQTELKANCSITCTANCGTLTGKVTNAPTSSKNPLIAPGGNGLVCCQVNERYFETEESKCVDRGRAVVSSAKCSIGSAINCGGLDIVKCKATSGCQWKSALKIGPLGIGGECISSSESPQPSASPTRSAGTTGAGAICNTGDGWPGTCKSRSDCNEGAANIAYDGTACDGGLGCCGVQPGSGAGVTTTGARPTIEGGMSSFLTGVKISGIPTKIPTTTYTGGNNPVATATKKPTDGGDPRRKCVEVCREGLTQLSNCTPPEADGTAAVSICDTVGRVESCGGNQFCCPTTGGNWTKDMTQCPDITPTQAPGEASVLNYKISFGGVNPTSAQCVINWPLQFIVLGGGESKVYTDIVPEIKTVVGNRLVFSGSLVLTGFSKTEGVAVFITGPKHLQVKYGKDNQSDVYNQAGGELVLTADASTSPVYDFSNYPIIPGDVVGVNSEAQDGWINGVDFAYVKAKSLVHETVTEGGYLKGDLDGNCQVNSNDVNLLKISLQDKQGQLY